MKIIISAFPCIGKTTLAKEYITYVDLESSNFWVDGERIPNWEKVYANIAYDLASNEHKIFVSSHQEVRDELSKRKDDDTLLISIYPSKALKEQWISKLRTRFEYEATEKNQKALDAAVKFYDKFIDSFESDDNFIKIVLEDIDYDLEYLIGKLIKMYW